MLSLIFTEYTRNKHPKIEKKGLYDFKFYDETTLKVEFNRALNEVFVDINLLTVRCVRIVFAEESKYVSYWNSHFQLSPQRSV